MDYHKVIKLQKIYIKVASLIYFTFFFFTENGLIYKQKNSIMIFSSTRDALFLQLLYFSLKNIKMKINFIFIKTLVKFQVCQGKWKCKLKGIIICVHLKLTY